VKGSNLPPPSAHRLQRGLPGYLILFATHAFVPQRQYWPRKLPSPSMFLPISTHFTATPGIPLSSTKLYPDSSLTSSPVKPKDFNQCLSGRLRTLYAQ
ncbi:uncharacterized protein METZ01_LOCUS432009, partial [marine metagenome]